MQYFAELYFFQIQARRWLEFVFDRNRYVEDACEIDINNQLRQLKWYQLFCQISY